MSDPRPQRPWAAIVSALCAVLLFASPIFYATCRDRRPRVTAFEITVGDLARSRSFFATLGFRAVDESRLQLGQETIVLRQKAADENFAVPARADDAAFQHIAIVVADIDRAFDQARSAGVSFVSDPQRLPDWNRDAAGIRAAYFRDPDGHFLELIQFPRFKGEPRWQERSGDVFLGVDHSAIVVADTQRAVAFYRDELGLAMTGESWNHGREQEALTGVPAANVHITSLRGREGPGLELIEYLNTKSPAPVAGNGWTIDLSHGGAPRSAHDPDGHSVELASASESFLHHAIAAFRAHWTRYLMEAAQLGAFMVATVWFTLTLEHPDSPVRRKIGSDVARRMLMGLAIGTTVVFIILSPFGLASGSHFNPSVTLAMLSAGRINPWDAIFYVAAQFLGGAAGVAIAAAPFWRASKQEKVDFAATVPGPTGVGVALIAEVVISFVLISTLLVVNAHGAVRPYAAYFAGVLLFLYITLEAPLSGMSMNPARTVASAIFARSLSKTWPYFVAPVPAMLLAAWIFGR